LKFRRFSVYIQQVILTVTDTYTRWHCSPKTIFCFEAPDIPQNFGMKLESNFACNNFVCLP